MILDDVLGIGKLTPGPQTATLWKSSLEKSVDDDDTISKWKA